MSTDLTCNPHGTVTLAELSDRELQIYLAGRFDGRVEGLRDGHALGLNEGRAETAQDWWRAGWLAAYFPSEATAAAAHAEAHRVVQAMAKLDSHEVHQLKGRIRTLEAALRPYEQRRKLHAAPSNGAAA